MGYSIEIHNDKISSCYVPQLVNLKKQFNIDWCHAIRAHLFFSKPKLYTASMKAMIFTTL